MKYLNSLLLIILFNNVFGQIEPLEQKFFSTNKKKEVDASFLIRVDNPTLKDGAYEFDIILTSNSSNESRTYAWSVRGPEIDTAFCDSINTRTVKIRVPFAPESHFFWQEQKNYTVSLALINKKFKLSWPMSRKIKFNVVKSGRKNLGNDFSYKVSKLWIASRF